MRYFTPFQWITSVCWVPFAACLFQISCRRYMC